MKIKSYLHSIIGKLIKSKEIAKMAILCSLPYKRQRKQNRKIIWFGAYGNTNIGDNLIFFSIRKYIPDNISILLSCRERIPSTDFGVPTFYKYDKKNWIRLIKESDIVLLGGGGLFEYYRNSYKSAEGWLLSYLLPLVYARYFRKTYAIVGMGCNDIVIPNPIVRYIFRKVSNDASFIITRDQKSKDGFIINGVNNMQLKYCFDPVFNYLPVKDGKPNNLTQTVGFLLWPYYMWPHFHNTVDCNIIRSRMSKDKIEAHIRFVNELHSCINSLNEKGIKCVFPIFHFSDCVLLKELGLPSEFSVPTIDNYFETISKCDMIITMRYHGQITSLLKGKPIISILVQEKMEALVDNFGLRDKMSIDIDNLKSTTVLKMIEAVYNDYDNIVNELYKKTVDKQNFVNQTYINIFNTFN